MTYFKVNTYLNLLGKTLEHEHIFSAAHQLYQDQLTFYTLIPKQLTQHCKLGRISKDRLTIYAENGAIASKLKQISPSLLLKMQNLGWEVTAIQILVQAPSHVKNSKPSSDKGNFNEKTKLSQTGKQCLNQLAATLPDSELKNTIQRFLEKHPND